MSGRGKALWHTIVISSATPTHELQKKCSGCKGLFKEDDVVCPKTDNKKQPAKKSLPNTLPGFQSLLFQYGFHQLQEQEIQQRNADRAALYDPVAVKEKQDALHEATKIKAEEAAEKILRKRVQEKGQG